MEYILNVLHYLLYGLAFFVLFFIFFEPVKLHYDLKLTWSRELVWDLFLSWLFLILFVTLLAEVYDGGMPLVRLELIPFHSLSDQWVLGDGVKYFHLAANVFFFTPFSFLLAMNVPKARNLFWNVGCTFALSFCIEFIQYFIGRTSDIDDLMCNTLGGLLGYVLYRLVNHALRRKSWWKALKA